MNFYGPDRNFLGLETHNTWELADVAILPVPLEQTTSYMTGTTEGPDALLKASHQVELFDDELKAETYKKGITTLKPLKLNKSDLMDSINEVTKKTTEILDAYKKTILIGGEHSLSVGSIRAVQSKFPDLHVLHLDAHADLRETYLGSPYNHACVMARIREICPFTSVGVRSISKEEAEMIQMGLLNVWDVHRLRKENNWIDTIINQLRGPIYITLDLDVFDPSVIPNVGTPEPGGMGWWETLYFLKQVFQRHQIVGLDLVELCPGAGPDYGVFNAAKLLYRLIGYWVMSY